MPSRTPPVHPDDVAALVAKSARLRERYEQVLRENERLRGLEQRLEHLAERGSPAERELAAWVIAGHVPG